MVITLGMPLVAALALELVRRRLGPAATHVTPAWTWYGVRAAVLVACALWFAGTPVLGSGGPLLVADADGHALVAAAIASGRATHGWIDVIGSGFPIGHHYPPLGFAILAGLVELGASPARAVAIVTLFGWIMPPLVVVEGARVHGLRPTAALAGALFVVAIEPYASFVGGWPVVARMGLVSQAIGVALAAVWIVASLADGRRRLASIIGALLIAAHPQVFVASAAALGLAALGAGSRAMAVRVAVSALPAVLVGVAIYGPGVHLAVPFGWPLDMGWLHVGPPPEKLGDFLEGDLVDLHRPPVLTVLWVFAVLALALRADKPAPRAAVAACVGVLLLAVAGEWLGSLGVLGRVVMSVFQPLRMLSILPLLGAGCIVLAIDALPAPPRGPLRALSLVVVLALVPEILARSEAVRGTLASFKPLAASRTCTVDGQPAPLDDELRDRLRALGSGRFAIVLPPQPSACMRALGIALDVPIPEARTNAVGAHVGITFAAFVELERGARWDEAEALGVRWVLGRAGDAPPPGTFRATWTRGPLALFERVTGTDRVGAACVREVWSGTEANLGAAIAASRADVLADPSRAIALEASSGALVRSASPPDGCDATAARVEEVPRESGAVEARVESRAPVDVVLRVSAFPAWRVDVDGAPASWRRVAPGFLAVRVPEGQHHVTAMVHLAGYAWRFALAVLAAIGAIFAPWDRIIRAVRARVASAR